MPSGPSDSDGFCSYPEPNGYGRSRSREMSEGELKDLQRHAAEHAKFKTVLSHVMERLADSEGVLRDIGNRLAGGDVLIQTLGRQMESSASLQEAMRGEAQAAAHLAREARASIEKHQQECADRWRKIERVLEKTTQGQAALMAASAASASKGMHPLVQAALTAVIAALASAAAMGALRSHFASETPPPRTDAASSHDDGAHTSRERPRR